MLCSPPVIRKGLVCKHIPHVILKSIASNPDITESIGDLGGGRENQGLTST